MVTRQVANTNSNDVAIAVEIWTTQPIIMEETHKLRQWWEWQFRGECIDRERDTVMRAYLSASQWTHFCAFGQPDNQADKHMTERLFAIPLHE
jgi:hypothetical protein